MPPNGWALLAIAAAVLLANLPYILGFFDPNPLGPRSGLGPSALGLTGGVPVLDPNNGITSQALGHRAAIDVVNGRMPWWNPYEGTGLPLAGEMQSAALFPPTLLTLFSGGQLYEHMLLEVLAGIATFLLLGRLGLARWAALIAGIAFALNGTSASFGHAPANPVAFLPLLILGIEKAYSASLAGRRGGWWLIAVAGALSLYAGFPEVAYVDALLATAWFLWRCGCLGRARVRALAGKAGTGLAAGVLLAAPLLVAFVGYLQHSDVAHHSDAYFGQVHLPAAALPHLLFPYVHGPALRYSDPGLTLASIWGGVGGYLSTSLLLLGLLGLLSKGRRGLKVMLLAWIVLAMSRIYGVPFLGDVLGVVPGMSRVLFPRYSFSSVELAVVVLAALGLHDLLSGTSESRRRLIWVTAASLAVVVIAAIGAGPLADRLGPVFSSRPYFTGSIAWGAVVVAALAGAALLLRHRRREVLVAVIVVADAMALFVFPELSAPRSVHVDMAPVAFLQRHLGQARVFTLGPLQPNYGSYFGIASLNVNDVPVATSFTNYVHRRLDQVVGPTHFVGTAQGGRPLYGASARDELLRNLEGYREAGVSYVLTTPGEALPESRATFTRVLRTPTAWIYRLAGSEPYFTATDTPCTVRSTTRLAASLTCPRSSTLVRRETALPGWSARVDDHPAPVRVNQGIFQAVAVKSGSHRVTFSYSPPQIAWAYLAFAVGCAWLLVGAALGRRQTSRDLER